MPARIGVTASTGDEPVEYLSALRAAGAEPVVFANEVERVEAMLASVDGLVVTGGNDVDPARFGSAVHSETECAGADRDAFELALVAAARERDVPVLAICRGLQIANVAFGGKLAQHLPDNAAAQRHRVQGVRGIIADHVIDIEPDSALARILGATRVATNSRHHQAADPVAAALRVVARTADGVVEALEPRFSARFWLAVQWHPETTVDDGGTSRRLFAALVSAAAAASIAR